MDSQRNMRSAGCRPFMAFSSRAAFADSSWKSDGSSKGSTRRRGMKRLIQVEKGRDPVQWGRRAGWHGWKCREDKREVRMAEEEDTSGVVFRADKHVLRGMRKWEETDQGRHEEEVPGWGEATWRCARRRKSVFIRKRA